MRQTSVDPRWVFCSAYLLLTPVYLLIALQVVAWIIASRQSAIEMLVYARAKDWLVVGFFASVGIITVLFMSLREGWFAAAPDRPGIGGALIWHLICFWVVGGTMSYLITMLLSLLGTPSMFPLAGIYASAAAAPFSLIAFLPAYWLARRTPPV